MGNDPRALRGSVCSHTLSCADAWMTPESAGQGGLGLSRPPPQSACWGRTRRFRTAPGRTWDPDGRGTRPRAAPAGGEGRLPRTVPAAYRGAAVSPHFLLVPGKLTSGPARVTGFQMPIHNEEGLSPNGQRPCCPCVGAPTSGGEGTSDSSVTKPANLPTDIFVAAFNRPLVLRRAQKCRRLQGTSRDPVPFAWLPPAAAPPSTTSRSGHRHRPTKTQGASVPSGSSGHPHPPRPTPSFAPGNPHPVLQSCDSVLSRMSRNGHATARNSSGATQCSGGPPRFSYQQNSVLLLNGRARGGGGRGTPGRCPASRPPAPGCPRFGTSWTQPLRTASLGRVRPRTPLVSRRPMPGRVIPGHRAHVCLVGPEAVRPFPGWPDHLHPIGVSAGERGDAVPPTAGLDIRAPGQPTVGGGLGRLAAAGAWGPPPSRPARRPGRHPAFFLGGGGRGPLSLASAGGERSLSRGCGTRCPFPAPWTGERGPIRAVAGQGLESRLVVQAPREGAETLK